MASETLGSSSSTFCLYQSLPVLNRAPLDDITSRIAPSSLGSIRLSRPPTRRRSIDTRNNNCDPSTSAAIALAQITKAPAVSDPGFRGDTQKRGHQASLRTELNPGIERTLLEQTKRIARILARCETA